MSAADDLRVLYRKQATDEQLDAPTRAVAREQLARLNRTRPGAAGNTDRRPSRWAHVPLDALLAQAGNAVTRRANGTLVSGHEPMHPSRSGRCLVIWSDA